MSGAGGDAQVIRQLQATLGKLELALSAVDDAIVWTDDAAVVQWCNGGFERICGRYRIDVLGGRLADLLPLRRGGEPVAASAHPAAVAMAGGEPDGAPYESGERDQAGLLEFRWSRTLIDGRPNTVFMIRDVTHDRRRDETLRQSEDRYRRLVESVRDYAIFMLDPQGRIATWNAGAQRIKGYSADEIVGRHFSIFYPEQDVREGKPERELEEVLARGSIEDEGYRVRKDGSLFWANVIITAVRGSGGQLLGFSKVTRDLTHRKLAEDALREAKAAAEAAGKELESFSYSVAHDLRAPLRAIDGFSKILLDSQAARLDEAGQETLRKVRVGVSRMSRLIDGLLALARVTRAELRRGRVDLSELAADVADALRQSDPGRRAEFVIAPGLEVEGDAVLLRVVMENLLGNSWKYTSRHPAARIEFGSEASEGRRVYFVRDDGAGFDMAFAHKLFTPFNRLHGPREFEGTGIGLATVLRVISRHQGRIWGEGRPEKGATFYFTLWEDR